jgi:thiol-disulfide isomerase/thioredoxin
MKFSTVLLALLVSFLVCGNFVAAEEEATATATTEETIATEEVTEGADATSSEGESVEAESQPKEQNQEPIAKEAPVQAGPLIDLFGESLYSFEMLSETQGQINANYTNEALKGKKVVGLYFSADWCGPCRQFTPELISFYERMNKRRGKKDEFEIVWISRCRDGNSYAQYFSQMPWLALPPEEAMGQRGQLLGEKYKVQSIPSLVLLDDLGNTITIDARNKIPQDKAGIGFPWRNPFSQLVSTLVPRSLRLLVKTQIDAVKTKFIQKLKNMIGFGKPVVA